MTIRHSRDPAPNSNARVSEQFGRSPSLQFSYRTESVGSDGDPKLIPAVLVLPLFRLIDLMDAHGCYIDTRKFTHMIAGTRTSYRLQDEGVRSATATLKGRRYAQSQFGDQT